jgi:hypothetical protein
LSGQQAKPAEFLVGENYFLAVVTAFQMAQATEARIAAQFDGREPEKDCCSMFLNPILKIPVHESHHLPVVRGAHENPNRHPNKYLIIYEMAWDEFGIAPLCAFPCSIHAPSWADVRACVERAGQKKN